MFIEVSVPFGEVTDAIKVRSVSEGERPVMTVDRKQPDLFKRLAIILHGSGAPAPEMED